MANNSNIQIVQLIGTGVVGAALISWILPKISHKPAAAAVPAAAVGGMPGGMMHHGGGYGGHHHGMHHHGMHHGIANSPYAHMLNGGIPRDYNLAGLSIGDVENYPSAPGVSLSF